MALFGYKEPILSSQEEIELSHAIQNGSVKALDKLVNANLRLVIYVVKELPFWNQTNSGMTFEDLIQIGNMYLIKAAREWKPRGSIRFATFARKVIHTWVKREYEWHSKTIYIPTNLQEQIRKVMYFEATTPHISTVALAKKTGYSVKKITELKSIMAREPVSLDMIQADKLIGDDHGN
jgi:RNA polymerase sigma factor (sigma-70 family)